MTTAPDGILKGYSEVLGLSLCWDAGWPRLYDPATKTYLTNWRQERAEREAAEARVAVEQASREVAEARVATERAARQAAEAERDAARLENDRLRAQLRRWQAGR